MTYKPERVEIKHQQDRRASWKKPGGRRAIKGFESLYTVRDRNFSRLNKWTFAVRVPPSAFGDVLVQPVQAPGKKVWASIERRPIMFVKATIHPYRSKVYCKLNLADPSGEKNRLGTTRGERSSLPSWFKHYKGRIRLKQTVAKTHGTDAKAQVILVGRDDHERMIRLYFAMRVWILEEGFMLER